MLSSSIFEQVVRFAGGESISAMHLLLGYAKLSTMKEDVRDVLFAEESERLELAKIDEMFVYYSIDAELLKQAAPFICQLYDEEKEKAKVNTILDKLKNDGENHTSLDVLKQLLTTHVTGLEAVIKGNTIDDVFKYVDDSKKQIDEKTVVSTAAQQSSEEKEQSADIGQLTATSEIETIPETATPVSGSSVEKRKHFESLVQKTNDIYDRLMQKVKGQNEAVRMFAEGYFQSRILESEELDKKKVGASFLFAGPPGVGKTYLASTAAEFLASPYLRLDMSEYNVASAVHKLSGLPHGFENPKPGVLTDFVNKHPSCIILVDEIEKAHDDVMNQFLQVLDGGILTDSFTGKTVDFRKAILIFTTNAGKSLYQDRTRENLSSIPKSVVVKAIVEEKDVYGESVIPEAICSRFASGNLIMFNFLGVHHLLDIINDQFAITASRIKKAYDYDVEIDSRVAAMLLYSQSTGMDARNITSQSSMLLKNEIYEFGRHVPNSNNSLTTLEKVKFEVDVPEEGEIAELFENKEVSNIILIGDKEKLSQVPFSEKCNIIYATTCDEAISIISENDVSFVVIDPMYGDAEEESIYLSLDDRKSESVYAFNEINDKLPQVPIYLLENEPINIEDKASFLEKGARGFIEFKDDVEFSVNIATICDILYMQKAANNLSNRGRVLSFSTAEKFSDDGKEAELIYYDFKIKLAANNDEAKRLLSDNDRPKDRFDDVIGAENAKSELEYFVNYIQNPKKYILSSVKPPKGILLYGPPGTGKTMLARAMAGECGASFFASTAAEFNDKYYGESEKKIRDLFATAKKFAPSIIFIDEIDAIGKERTGSDTNQHTESMLNTLLTEMDGFDSDPTRPVFMLAATNYDLDGTKSGKSRAMDPALIRRFDNRIYVDLPNESERELFLNKIIDKSNITTVSQNAIHNIAQRTTGESLAILKNVFELAIRNAGKAGEIINDDYLLNALEEYMYGEKKEWGKEYFKSTAIHESGHAYICTLSGEKPSFVTIVSRGNFGGYMQHSNAENIPSYSKDDLIWRIRTALAGRAAEIELYNEKTGVNTGASSDLKHATDVAMNMIARYAMNDDSMYSLDPELILSSPLADEFLQKVDNLLKEEMAVTRKLVSEGKDKIKKLADFLVVKNQATEQEIENCFAD